MQPKFTYLNRHQLLPMRHALPVLFLLLVVSSGCATTVNQPPSTADPATPDGKTPSATATGVAETLNLSSLGTACDELYVDFWGLNEEQFWQPDVVRVNYDVPPNTSFLLATYVDGAVRGVSYETNEYDDGVNVDGAELELDTPLSGEHVVQVVIYHDEDGDGQLDRDVDPPCLNDGVVVKTRPARVDFSRFD